VAQLAALLGAQHRPEGVTVCGTPIGTDAFVAAALSARADAVIAQIDKLATVPVNTQARFLVLRASLSLRMAHLMRTVVWERLEPSTARVEKAVIDAVADVFQVPAQGAAAQQMKLPIRHGGFGLRDTVSVVADAALVAGASKAQAAMEGGLDACKPFSGAARPALLAAWHRVFDDVGAACEWDASVRDPSPEFVLTNAPGPARHVAPGRRPRRRRLPRRVRHHHGGG
jgi:hypothetical protein